VLLGVFLDQLFGTSPWLSFFFSFIGLAAAFVEIFRTAKAYEKKLAQEANDKHRI